MLNSKPLGTLKALGFKKGCIFTIPDDCINKQGDIVIPTLFNSLFISRHECTEMSSETPADLIGIDIYQQRLAGEF